MFSSRNCILIADNEGTELTKHANALTDSNYSVIQATNGQQAIDILTEKSQDISVVLLERTISNPSGMAVLKRISDDQHLKNIPVVMQTSDTAKEKVIEGIHAGVFHYLSKPFDTDVMLAVVQNAIDSAKEKNQLIDEMHRHTLSLGLMETCCFNFRTPMEAKGLSFMLSNCFPDPDNVIVGLLELMLNAIEHGNLSINHDDKTTLIKEMRLREEIERRLELDEYIDKYATVHLKRHRDKIELRITDMGTGFDWKDYMRSSVDRVLNPHGRGIAIAALISFDTVEYQGKGNDVLCTVNL